MADLLHQFPGVFGSPSEDSTSSSPSGPAVRSPSVPMLSTMVDWAVKVWLPFSFLEGNKFPNGCCWVTFDPPVMVVFGSKGSLALAYLSNFCAARSKSEKLAGCCHPPCGPTCTSIWGLGPHRNYLISSPPHAPVESFLGLLWQAHSKHGCIPPGFLL